MLEIWIISFGVVLCWPSFVLLSFYWLLYCLSFFELRLLIIALASSNFSYDVFVLRVMDYIVLAINQLTKDMHWPCYCTVHVYVVIHVCDSMRASWVVADMFFHCLFIYVLLFEVQFYQERIFSFMCMFCRSLFVLCTFSFCHCVVYSSIYGFWFLPLWYLQTLLIITDISTYICKTQIHVRPQICALSLNLCLPTNPCPIKLLYPQIRVLLPRRYVSFGIASHSNPCPPKSIFPQICVLHFGRKMTS